MAEALYGIVSCGRVQSRVMVMDREMRTVGAEYVLTNPSAYETTIERIAVTMQQLASGKGEVVAASMTTPDKVDDEGRILRAGGLSGWLGKRIGVDTATALGIPPERVGFMNDMVAVARSQYSVNDRNRVGVNGIVMELGSRWGGATYSARGAIKADDPGHEYLRSGAQCSCGQQDHAEAFISGNGVLRNHGLSMEDWLTLSGSDDTFVNDVAKATVAMLERQRGNGFDASEIRWMGGIVTSQQLLMTRAFKQVCTDAWPNMPIWEAVTMGEQAGLHGAFMDADQRAAAG